MDIRLKQPNKQIEMELATISTLQHGFENKRFSIYTVLLCVNRASNATNNLFSHDIFVV